MGRQEDFKRMAHSHDTESSKYEQECYIDGADDGKSHFGFYSNKGVWFSSVYGFNGHQVTHWMPMPQVPGKEESNERG